MKVEIWSDIICPYCYMGKKIFDSSLKKNQESLNIEIENKSYLLIPDIKKGEKYNYYDFIADSNNISYQEAINKSNKIEKFAFKVAGLRYNLNKAIISSTFDAHRLIHLGKKYSLSNRIEELLYHAFFTDGKNIDDNNILVEIGTKAGLSKNEIIKLLESDDFSETIYSDMREADALNLYYIPFFLFDKKQIVTGIVKEEDFINILKKPDFRNSNNIEGKSCTLDGKCS